ncbi:hypothetical protein U9M48_005707 [Paspalum notatum var. saurae]|uniref:Uncharacterized protein n=1 Tax=Paspalum notatum var. saurae TaxID=547442 RepID=A0AAQ3PQR7_PASNO
MHVFWAIFVLAHDCFSDNAMLNSVAWGICSVHSFVLVPYNGCGTNRSPGKRGSHFHPSSDLFVLQRRHHRLLEPRSWRPSSSPWPVLKLFGVPYAVSVAWMDLAGDVRTYLHHHGSQDLRWYRGGEWTGANPQHVRWTPRDYGWVINAAHHDMNTFGVLLRSLNSNRIEYGDVRSLV